MSMMDSYDVVCSHCGREHSTYEVGHMDCPYCGKRWIIEIRPFTWVDPSNRKRVEKRVQIYLNGCKWSEKPHSYF